MIYVRDLAGNEYRAQATITNDYELNGNQSVEATFLPSETNREFIESIAELWTLIDHDGVEHKITYAKRQGAGDSLTVAVQGVPRFFDVLDTTRIYERVDAHMTAMQAFTRIFDGLPFVFVLVDSFDAVQWEGFGEGESRIETFKRALDRYGAEFRIVGNTVYLHAMIGNDTQMQYRHRLNASNIVMENDASAMYTFARGYGNYGDGEGGEDWQNAKLVREYTSPLAQIASIGIRHAPPIKNGNITDAKTMDAALKTLVDESLKISVSADIHDLRAQGYPQAQPELGDRVFLIDERIGLNDEVRVAAISITRNWRGRVIDFKLTFGTPGLSRRYQSDLNTAVKTITDVLEGRKTLPITFLDERVKEISDIINGNTNSVFKYTANGVVGWNGNNPNYMTRYVGDAIGFSKDGGATYGTAMSAELGIVADYITTGTLRAIIVDGVEIYGSHIEGNTIQGGRIDGTHINGSTFTSQASERVYTKIQGAYVESRGRHTRTWRGKTETHDVLLKMENGYFRARNNDKNWSLYFSDYGISTYNDAVGDNDSSGYMEFHSAAYSPSNSTSGLTIGSLAGRVAVETKNSRIYLNTGGASVFVGDMSDNTFPIIASAFTQSSSRELKRDIIDLQDDALAVLNTARIREYRRLTNGETTIYDEWQAGLILDEAPLPLVKAEGIDVYTMLSYAVRAIQQLDAKIEAMEAK